MKILLYILSFCCTGNTNINLNEILMHYPNSNIYHPPIIIENNNFIPHERLNQSNKKNITMIIYCVLIFLLLFSSMESYIMYFSQIFYTQLVNDISHIINMSLDDTKLFLLTNYDFQIPANDTIISPLCIIWILYLVYLLYTLFFEKLIGNMKYCFNFVFTSLYICLTYFFTCICFNDNLKNVLIGNFANFSKDIIINIGNIDYLFSCNSETKIDNCDRTINMYFLLSLIPQWIACILLLIKDIYQISSE